MGLAMQLIFTPMLWGLDQMALTLGWLGQSPEYDLRSGGGWCPVCGFLGAETAAGSFLGAGVGA